MAFSRFNWHGIADQGGGYALVGARWPREVDETLWSLLCEGHKPTAITRLLNNGDAGLPEPVPIGINTVVDKCQRLRKERGEPKTFVAEGRELDAAGSLRRKALDMARVEIDKLEAKDSLVEKEVRHLIAVVKLVDDIEVRLRDRERDKDAAKAAGGQKGRPGMDVLASIAKSEEERGVEERRALDAAIDRELEGAPPSPLDDLPASPVSNLGE